MTYDFKEKITYKQYCNFIEKQKGLSYMQEEEWAHVKNNKNHMIVAAVKDNEVCALAHILIKKKILGFEFYIPNGFIVDFTNKKLLSFFSNSISKLALEKKAYVINMYPNIDKSNPNSIEINKNLLNLNYKYKNKYLDKSTNILIPINKFKNIDESLYLKKGIYFEKSSNIYDIERLNNIILDDYFKPELVKSLMDNFGKRVSFIFAKLDLVFYENYLLENHLTSEINKIQELLQISDEIDIGCAIILEPFSKNNEVCEYLYNTEKESFEHLGVTNGMLNLALKYCNKKKYKYLKVSNINLNKKIFIDEFKGKQINYIGNYKLIINKLVNAINK